MVTLDMSNAGRGNWKGLCALASQTHIMGVNGHINWVF